MKPSYRQYNENPVITAPMIKKRSVYRLSLIDRMAIFRLRTGACAKEKRAPSRIPRTRVRRIGNSNSLADG